VPLGRAAAAHKHLKRRHVHRGAAPGACGARGEIYKGAAGIYSEVAGARRAYRVRAGLREIQHNRGGQAEAGFDIHREHVVLDGLKAPVPHGEGDVPAGEHGGFREGGGGRMYGRIGELRKGEGLTQKELAELLGMSQTGYSKYETGTLDIPTGVLVELARHYNVSTDYLLGVTDVRKPYRRNGMT